MNLRFHGEPTQDRAAAPIVAVYIRAKEICDVWSKHVQVALRGSLKSLIACKEIPFRALTLSGARGPNAPIVAWDRKLPRYARSDTLEILRALDLLKVISANWKGKSGDLLLICKVDND